MFTDPVALIDQTIDNLETLSVLFEDETDARTHRPSDLTLEAKRCLDAQRARSEEHTSELQSPI